MEKAAAVWPMASAGCAKPKKLQTQPSLGWRGVLLNISP